MYLVITGVQKLGEIIGPNSIKWCHKTLPSIPIKLCTMYILEFVWSITLPATIKELDGAPAAIAYG
jgi:hypothetical protein